jgi:hypothetical protein
VLTEPFISVSYGFTELPGSKNSAPIFTSVANRFLAVLVHQPVTSAAMVGHFDQDSRNSGCSYGWLMMPIAWHWALLIWGYALAGFPVNDRIKLGAYRLFSGRPPR